MGKDVSFPGGPTSQEANVIGLERQVRVNTDTGNLHVHNGQTPGGHVIPTLEQVRLEISGSSGGTTNATVQYFSTELELEEAVPSPTTIAVLNESGKEDIFVWKDGVNDGGGINSQIQGYWHRLDTRMGFWVRMYRAGLVNLQLDGVEPVANQDITAWLDNGTLKLWDGADYLAATPVLFARLLRKIGNYDALGALPDRLADVLVEVADLNAVTDTGWYKSAAADANAPSVTPSLVLHSKIDANTMQQIFYLQGSANRDAYVRFKAAGAWGTWTLVPGVLADRLAAVSAVIVDANSALDSGFYHMASGGANMPVAENGVLIVSRYSSTEAAQLFVSTSTAKLYVRKYAASAWAAWVPYNTAAEDTAALALKMSLIGAQTVTGGFKVTPANLGNIATQTLNPDLGNYQYGNNNGAFTLTAPADDCAVDLLVTNTASAGSITLSGFTVASGNTGDPLTTTNGHRFLISMRRIGGVSTYVIKALQ